LEDTPDENILPYIDDAIAYIDDKLSKGSRVLVHCAAGISRSASFVIAYLMKTNKWTFERSIDYVQRKRPIIKPNTGFIKQLQQYEVTS